MSTQIVVANVQYSDFLLKDGDSPLWNVTFRKDMREASFLNADTGNFFAWDFDSQAVTQLNEPYWWHVPRSTSDAVYSLQVLLDGQYLNLTLISYSGPDSQLGLDETSGNEAKWRLVPAGR